MTYRVREIDSAWFWELVFSNGRVAATSDATYRSKQLAVRAVRRVIDAQRGGLWNIETPSESLIGSSL